MALMRVLTKFLFVFMINGGIAKAHLKFTEVGINKFTTSIISNSWDSIPSKHLVVDLKGIEDSSITPS